MPYANKKGADQPAHPRSLASVFVVRCLDSIIPLVSSSEIFKPLPSFCGCAGRFESYLVENTEDRFSHDEAQILSPGYPKQNDQEAEDKQEVDGQWQLE